MVHHWLTQYSVWEGYMDNLLCSTNVNSIHPWYHWSFKSSNLGHVTVGNVHLPVIVHEILTLDPDENSSHIQTWKQTGFLSQWIIRVHWIKWRSPPSIVNPQTWFMSGFSIRFLRWSPPDSICVTVGSQTGRLQARFSLVCRWSPSV